MEPIVIIFLVGMVVLYFIFYRPQFITRPAREREELIQKFEQVAALNRQLLTDLRNYAEQYKVLDKPFFEGDSFRKKINELEAARNELFSEENYDGLRALNPKKLDMELMSKSLDDQVIYHHRLQAALNQYKANPVRQ
jgi:hypothetical protein